MISDMNDKIAIHALIFISICLIALTCEKERNYESWAKKELNSDVVNDSLFMGYYFGMSKDEFYDHSWKLNKKQLVTNGGSNMSIKKELDALDYPATMLFFPEFKDNKIAKLLVRYRYNGWAPWNKEMDAEHLKEDIFDYYKKKFGIEFKKIEHDGQQKIISIRGNQEIEMTTEHDNSVILEYRDLRVYW